MPDNKNDVTSKSDSQVTPAQSKALPLAAEIAALEAEEQAEKQKRADRRKKLAALKLHARREKIAHKDADREAEKFNKVERIYRCFNSVIPPASAGRQERADWIAEAERILVEYKTNSIDQRFSPAAIKDRRDARILAEGK